MIVSMQMNPISAKIWSESPRQEGRQIKGPSTHMNAQYSLKIILQLTRLYFWSKYDKTNFNLNCRSRLCCKFALWLKIRNSKISNLGKWLSYEQSRSCDPHSWQTVKNCRPAKPQHGKKFCYLGVLLPSRSSQNHTQTTNWFRVAPDPET